MWGQVQPLEHVQNALECAFNQAVTVCVLDANNKLTTVLMGENVVEQRLIRSSHMGVSGGAGGNAGTGTHALECSVLGTLRWANGKPYTNIYCF